MKLIPINNSVICEVFVPEFQEKTVNGVQYTDQQLPMFRILGKDSSIPGFEVGDVIVCNSTGTRIVDSGKQYRLFMKDNIVCKISK